MVINGSRRLCIAAGVEWVVAGQNCSMNMTAVDNLRTPRLALADPGSWPRMGRRLVAGLVGAVVAWGTRPVEEVDAYSGPDFDGPDPLAFDLLASDVAAADPLPDDAASDGVRTAELVRAHGRP
jgi:hypothetical protein